MRLTRAGRIQGVLGTTEDTEGTEAFAWDGLFDVLRAAPQDQSPLRITLAPARAAL